MDFTAVDFQNDFTTSFGKSLSPSQQLWLEVFSMFLTTPQKESIFVLKGYAGTGKSTLIGHLVRRLPKFAFRAVLLAPTGRAAKVLSSYAKRKAFTIHKHMYYTNAKAGGGLQFRLRKNNYTNTLFIVDEASMISADRLQSKLFENGSLLDDLIEYVDSGKNCRLMLVGDTAQLPPVHLDQSPALDVEHLSYIFNKDIQQATLVDVQRQTNQSGMLFNATALREYIAQQLDSGFRFQLRAATDVVRVQDGNELLEALQNSLHDQGVEGVVFLVRSNKRANLYNQNIRQRILFLDAELSVGDQLMVVKNNYFWLDDTAAAGFIANGDTIAIERIYEYRSLYGFQFARVQVQMVDYPDQAPFETYLLLDTLKSESAALTQEENQKLYQEVNADYAHLRSKYKRLLEVKKNPFFNALQVKYSYAVTCHKSQGGQWHTVFVEQPYLPEGTSLGYYRWLYTALTRATDRLYLVGFTGNYFEEE